MQTSLKRVLENKGENYIFPFLWMKGESRDVIETEIEKIYECGIRAICIESRPHPDFLGEGWWADMDFIIEKAKELGMKLWLLDDAHFPTGYANHLIPEKYPERKKVYINYNVQDVWGAQAEMTLPIDCMMQPKTSWLDIGKDADFEERKNNRPVAVTAYRLIRDNKIDVDSAIDLLPLYKEESITVKLPKGNWRVFTVYETRTDGGHPDYINIIDEDSVAVLIEAVYQSHYDHYKDDFGTVFAGFFSDEPGFGNVSGFLYDEAIGKKEMPLPWNKDVPGMLEERLGADWKFKLPLLWIESVKKDEAAQARLAYMDVVTALYAKNFCGQLGRWCEERGVEYVGHVIEDNGEHVRLGCGAGHYFRAMSGQHMAGIDSIGSQILPGGAGLTHKALVDLSGSFFHYVLAKLGSSAGAIDPQKKGRALCEAFGAYGWKFGVRDMKWLADHLLVQGINHFVPHAFSMAEYPDFDCPPHFYARGNNPQFSHFAELMKYTNRMCELLNGGKHGARVAVLYTAESEWMGDEEALVSVAEVLSTHQIDFDILPADVLADLPAFAGAVSEDGKTLFVNEQAYKALVVPACKHLPKTVDDFASAYPQFDVCFVDAYPETVVDVGTETGCAKFIEKGHVLALESLPAYGKDHMFSSFTLQIPFPSMLVYDYEKNGKSYMLFNTDLDETFDGEICVDGEKDFLLYDAMKNEAFALACRKENKKTYITLTLPPYQSVLLIEGTGQGLPLLEQQEKGANKAELVLDLSRSWQVSSCRAIDYPAFSEPETVLDLEPFSQKAPCFSGYIRYEKTFTLKEAWAKATLQAEHVYECANLWVDDVFVGGCICPPYRFELPSLCAGEHRLRIEVATTLDREQQTLPKPPFQYLFEPLEPTGMFEFVTLEGWLA